MRSCQALLPFLKFGRRLNSAPPPQTHPSKKVGKGGGGGGWGGAHYVNQAGMSLFQVNNRNTRGICEIYSNLTIKMSEHCLENALKMSKASCKFFNIVIKVSLFRGSIHISNHVKVLWNTLRQIFFTTKMFIVAWEGKRRQSCSSFMTRSW